MSHARDHWPTIGAGRPMDFNPEMVEAALWQVALAGGSVRQGHQALFRQLCADAGVDPDAEASAGVECPSEITVRRWTKGRFRNRYHEILEVKAAELDGRVASSAVELALLIEDGERKAIIQATGKIGQADGVEASVIGRNLSQMKKIQVEAAGQIRGRQALGEVLPALADIARSMAQMGFATIDSDAEEIPAAELVEG